MIKGARQRWALLIALFTAAVSAAAWVRETDRSTDVEVVEAPVRQAPAASTKPMYKEQAIQRVHLEKLTGRSVAGRTEDAFAPRGWRRLVPRKAAATNTIAVAL